MEHKDADVTTLKVKQLKALIQAAGLSHADCFEKSDLRARATAAHPRSTCSPASGKLTYPRVLPISS